MSVEARITAGTARRARLGTVLGTAALAACLLAPGAAQAADAAGTGPGGKSAAVRLEPLPGSDAKRVILSAKAAQRLGIEAARVSEQVVVRRQMVGGLVILPLKKLPEPAPATGSFGGFGGFGQQPATPAPPAGAVPAPAPARQPVAAVAPARPPAPAGEVWVLTTLSPAEWEKLAKDKPARLLPLDTRDPPGHELVATPLGGLPVEDMKRSMLSVYYVVSGNDHGLTVNSRLRVELPLTGSEDKQKVVPYGAVYYDAKGAAWVYVNPKPLVFERQSVSVERVVGDVAVLSSGPPLGTAVVTVGAALLYGAEIFGK